MKNFSACGLIPSIRRVYQVLFYISTFFLIDCLVELMKADAALRYYIIIVFAWACSYAVLLVLRALEFLIGRIFYLEQELVKKGVVQRPEQNENNN